MQNIFTYILLLICIVLSICTTLLFLEADFLVMAGCTILFVIGYYIVLWALYIIFLCLISIPISKRKAINKPNRFYKSILMFSCRLALDQFHVHVHVKKNVEFPKDERFLLVSNHVSNLDPMIIEALYYNSEIVHISKIELIKAPVLGNILHKCGYLGMDRQKPKEEAKTIVRAIKMLKDDVASVCVLPEGTRNKSGKGLLPFKHGCFKIALKSQKPIVVASFKGTNEVKKNPLFARHDVNLSILAKIEYEQYKDMNTIEISNMVRTIIEADLNK